MNTKIVLKAYMGISSSRKTPVISLFFHRKDVARWGKGGLDAQQILQTPGALSSPSDTPYQGRLAMSVITIIFILHIVCAATVGSTDS